MEKAHQEIHLKVKKMGGITKPKMLYTKNYCRENVKYRRYFNDIICKRRTNRLVEAVLTNNESLVGQILDKNSFHEVNVNTADEHKRTPLHLAASRGYSSIVKLLLEHGANPSLKDSLGNTPLHLASCTGNVSIVNELLASGADAKIEDSRGCNPIQLAQGRLRFLVNWAKSAPSNDSTVLMNQVKSVVNSLIASLDKEQAERVSNYAVHNNLVDSNPEHHISALLHELELLTL